MPFQSERQRRACWAKYREDQSAGRTPKWDCYEWEHAKMHTSRVISSEVLVAAKHDLETYPSKDIQTLAARYSIPAGTSLNDTLWMIAIENFLSNN